MARKTDRNGVLEICFDGDFAERTFGVYAIRLIAKNGGSPRFIYIGKTGDNNPKYLPRSAIYRLGRHFHDKKATDNQIAVEIKKEGYNPGDFDIELRYVLLSFLAESVGLNIKGNRKKIKLVNLLESALIFDCRQRSRKAPRLINTDVISGRTRENKERELERNKLRGLYDILKEYLFFERKDFNFISK